MRQSPVIAATHRCWPNAASRSTNVTSGRWVQPFTPLLIEAVRPADMPPVAGRSWTRPALSWAPRIGRAAGFDHGHTQDTVGRNTVADVTLESRRAAVIYFSGSVPVIFFKPWGWLDRPQLSPLRRSRPEPRRPPAPPGCCTPMRWLPGLLLSGHHRPSDGWCTPTWPCRRATGQLWP
jgi:hypothetical protein